jgi:hypothetical protein
VISLNKTPALAELAHALARPQQRGLRIAACRRFDQQAQIVEQARIRRAQRPATAPDGRTRSGSSGSSARNSAKPRYRHHSHARPIQ